MASHDKCIAIRRPARIEQPHVGPDRAHLRRHAIRHHVKVVAGVNIGKQTTGSALQSRLNKAEKCLGAQVAHRALQEVPSK